MSTDQAIEATIVYERSVEQDREMLYRTGSVQKAAISMKQLVCD
jgi:hypothetical protein